MDGGHVRRWNAVRGWVERVLGRRRTSTADRRSRSRRALRLEPLEARSLLAITNLGEISGLVFKDTSGNGFTPGEEVAGATVRLFQSNGDSTFDPGGTDPQLQSTTTNSQGRYQFSGLTAGSYWVQQIAQVVGATTLNEAHQLQVISAVAAAGTAGLQIDSYATPVPALSATLPTNSASGVGAAAEAIGGERDLVMQIVSGSAGDQVQFGVSANRLNLTADAGAVGAGTATWDGIDGNATTLNPTGLGGVNLASNGATGLRLAIGADRGNASVTVRLYTSGTNFSTLTTGIPEITAQDPNPELFLPFTLFQIGGGTGANPQSIGAIQVEINTQLNGTDVRGELFGGIGPTVQTVDFNNFSPADLAITKQVNIANPNVGQQVQFTITVTNNGPSGATNVLVTDQLPAGVTFNSANPSQGSYNSGTGVWTVGSLATQGSAALTLIGTVTTIGAKTNTATITGADQPDTVTGNNQAQATVTPAQVDIAVTKSVNDNTPDRNQQVTFQVGVSNNGPSNATNLRLTDTLPSGLTFVSANATVGTYASATGTWTVGNLAANASASLSIVATVTSVPSGTTLVNTAQLLGVDQPDGNSENNQASVTLTPNTVDLAVTKTVDDATPDKNQNVTFTVTVNNTANVAATNVVLTDQLPAGITFQSVNSVSQGNYNSTTGVWTIGTINGGASATLRIVGQVTAATTLTNTASITSLDQFETSTTNNQASVSLTPNVVDLVVAKTASDTTPDRNQEVTFTVTVNNSSQINATNVSVNDTLPTGLTFVRVDQPSTGTYNSTTGVWTIGALNAQATATLLLVARMAGPVTQTGQTFTNTASVAAVDQFETNTGNNQASAVVTPNVLDLAITKTASAAIVPTSQTVNFTITVTNNGPLAATNVQVTDLLPTGLTFVSVVNASQGTYNSTTGVWTVGGVGTTSGQNSATLQIQARMTAVGTQTITNSATITGVDQFETNTGNNTATAAVTTQLLSKRNFLADTLL